MINTKAEAIKGTRNKSVKNMKLRKAKEANQDIGAIKMLYLCNHKEFDRDIPFTSQVTYSSSEWVLFKEARWFNQLQTRLWRPGNSSRHPGDSYKRPEDAPGKTDMHGLIMESSNDICSFFDSYLPTNESSSHEITWRMFSTQLRSSSKKNQIKRSSDVGVMKFANQETFSSREFGPYGSSSPHLDPYRE
ncbi:hypothetical protein YC2023_040151 [Brassica napus]